ncbi:hypothetical protein AW736_02550 [Termitidicoccus mucosus]|uniref:Uncharacterized protein n=1 Tax=Termitidicoccus mucosus TaxID=1184151 RepID=A0A178IP91_9BACT|nr:hypothetical protein AW736_02550 [Opitutaceae bacterium TSB47]
MNSHAARRHCVNEAVVIDKVAVAGVVGRIDVDAFDAPGEGHAEVAEGGGLTLGESTTWQNGSPGVSILLFPQEMGGMGNAENAAKRTTTNVLKRISGRILLSLAMCSIRRELGRNPSEFSVSVNSNEESRDG